MPQYLRPDSTLAFGSFVPSGPLAGGLHSVVNETTPDDISEFRNAPGTTDTASCELGLSDALDPQQSTGHILKLRGYVSEAFDCPVTMNLKEGASIRATLTTSFLTASATYTYTLTASEANSITNYNNLSVEVVKESSPDACRIFVTWIEFEIPTPGRIHVDYVNGALTVVPLSSGNYLKIVSGAITRVAGIEVAGALILSGTQIATWDGVS